MPKRLLAALSASLALALPATVHASPGGYAHRLALNAQDAKIDGHCLVLRSIDLCGWRVKLARDATEVMSQVGCRPGSCWFEWSGRTTGEPFFCHGYMGWHPRTRRWVADQSMDCYGDRDPSWGFTDDGTLFREPS